MPFKIDHVLCGFSKLGGLWVVNGIRLFCFYEAGLMVALSTKSHSMGVDLMTPPLVLSVLLNSAMYSPELRH